MLEYDDDVVSGFGEKDVVKATRRWFELSDAFYRAIQMTLHAPCLGDRQVTCLRSGSGGKCERTKRLGCA